MNCSLCELLQVFTIISASAHSVVGFNTTEQALFFSLLEKKGT